MAKRWHIYTVWYNIEMEERCKIYGGSHHKVFLHNLPERWEGLLDNTIDD
ncbi:hypothetical protein SESBI_01785 [Sesbania bispinosa]|nr:hypothetical protein SESBI_01785 [Sesbania bispinosa]